MMKHLFGIRRALARFRAEETGASLIEYSILIGLMTATVLAIVLVVGAWMGSAWTDLNSQLT
jgi:pilus assembly protein Flp/PilA